MKKYTYLLAASFIVLETVSLLISATMMCFEVGTCAIAAQILVLVAVTIIVALLIDSLYAEDDDDEVISKNDESF